MRMHEMVYFKIIDAQQAKVIDNCKNAKHKLLKTKAATWFAMIRGSSHITPKYTNIKMKGNNQRNKNTKIAAARYRLNQEIRLLYKKKDRGGTQ